jgi:hypothetical protein
MKRCLPTLAIALVAALPFSIKPTWVVGAIAIGAGLFCLVGLLWRSLGTTLVGCVFAVIDLALALWWSASSMSVFGAVIFGLALLFLLDTAHFANRFAGADIDPSVWGAQAAWWIARAAILFGVAILLVVIAAALTSLMPIPGRPVIAAAGALAAFLAALLLVMPEKGGDKSRSS